MKIFMTRKPGVKSLSLLDGNSKEEIAAPISQQKKPNRKAD
jgi:hypothetical protein